VTTAPRFLLDTNAVVGAGYGRSNAFKRLLSAVRTGQAELIVPEVVVLETAWIFDRGFRNLKQPLEELKRLLRAGGVDPRVLDDPEALQHAMEADLREALENAGVEPAPSPVVDHDELVRRILARRKPTKDLVRDRETGLIVPDQGEGYRDQLIWAHVRAAAETGDVIFVAADKDFGVGKPDKTGLRKLQPQLAEDLEQDRAAGRSTGQVELLVSIDAAVDRLPEDEDAAELAERLLEQDATAAGFVSAVRDAAGEQTLDLDTYVEPIPFQYAEISTELVSLTLDEHLELVDAWIEDGEDDDPLVVGMNIDLRAVADIDWSATALSPWDLDVYAGRVESPDAGGLIHDTDDAVPLRLVASGLYDLRERAWSGVSIDFAAMTEDEARRRSNEHAETTFKLEQEAGLMPPDEWFEQAEEDESEPRPPRTGNPHEKFWRRERRRRFEEP
jgi:hypothetical protein